MHEPQACFSLNPWPKCPALENIPCAMEEHFSGLVLIKSGLFCVLACEP